MATVYDGAPPPQELTLAWQCQSWNTLPEVGGLYEQDYVLMTRMRIALNIYGALKAWRDKYSDGHNIHNTPDSVRRIIRELKKDGLI